MSSSANSSSNPTIKEEKSQRRASTSRSQVLKSIKKGVSKGLLGTVSTVTSPSSAIRKVVSSDSSSSAAAPSFDSTAEPQELQVRNSSSFDNNQQQQQQQQLSPLAASISSAADQLVGPSDSASSPLSSSSLSPAKPAAITRARSHTEPATTFTGAAAQQQQQQQQQQLKMLQQQQQQPQLPGSHVPPDGDHAAGGGIARPMSPIGGGMERQKQKQVADALPAQQQQQLPPQPQIGKTDSEESDEDWKMAKAMAMAIQNNPNMKPAEIRAQISSTLGSGGGGTNAQKNNQPTGGNNGSGGGVAAAAAPTSPTGQAGTGATTTTTAKEKKKTGLRNFQNFVEKATTRPSTLLATAVSKTAAAASKTAAAASKTAAAVSAAAAAGVHSSNNHNYGGHHHGNNSSSQSSSSSTAATAPTTNAAAPLSPRQGKYYADNNNNNGAPGPSHETATAKGDAAQRQAASPRSATPLTAPTNSNSKDAGNSTTSTLRLPFRPSIKVTTQRSPSVASPPSSEQFVFEPSNDPPVPTLRPTSPTTASMAAAAFATSPAGAASADGVGGIGTAASDQDAVAAAAAAVAQQEQDHDVQHTIIPQSTKEAPIRLTGIAWKRRGGMGKFSTTSAWERRRIELAGNKLMYYRALGESEVTDEGVMMPAAAPTTSSSRDESTDGGITTAGAATAPSPTMQATTAATAHHHQQQQQAAQHEAIENSQSAEGVVVAKKTTWFEQAAATLAQAATTAAGDDITSPRGYMDLAKEKATIQTSMGHSGAPSPFAISIKVRGETKWKFCFDYHKQQMEWMAALTDVAVQASVDSYNAHLLEAADPTAQQALLMTDPASIFTQAPMFHEPPGAKDDVGGSHHRLWQVGSYNISSHVAGPIIDEAEDDDDNETLQDANEEYDGCFEGSAITAEADASEQLAGISIPPPDVELATKTWTLPEKNLFYAASMVNAALAFARASSTSMDAFWYLVAFCNLGVFLCLVKEPDWRSLLQMQKDARAEIPIRASAYAKKQQQQQQAAQSPSKQQKQKKAAVTAASASASAAETATATTPPDKQKPEFVPTAGTTTVQLKNTTDAPINGKNELFAGWRKVPGDSLMVRSHGYLETKEKVASPGTLYDCVQVDIFESPNRYPEMATRVKLPECDFDDKGQPKTWRCPDLFVISIALPTDPPKLGRTSSDGGGYTITMYLKMREETRNILRRVTAEGYDPAANENDGGDDNDNGEANAADEDPQKSRVNAVRLLEEWCRRAPTDPKFQSRFKVVPNAHNLEEIGMPSWISKYNGKPFLIKRAGVTGFLFTRPELSCVEFDISLHPFPYLAKQGICFMKDAFFKKVLVSFGFVIEGRSDDELPECLIGLFQLCYPDPAHAIQASDFFSGTCRRSF